jgi:hypothetical protein
MAEARVERRLSAILAADVAGYSRAALEDAQALITRNKRNRISRRVSHQDSP